MMVIVVVVAVVVVVEVVVAVVVVVVVAVVVVVVVVVVIVVVTVVVVAFAVAVAVVVLTLTHHRQSSPWPQDRLLQSLWKNNTPDETKQTKSRYTCISQLKQVVTPQQIIVKWETGMRTCQAHTSTYLVHLTTHN